MGDVGGPGRHEVDSSGLEGRGQGRRDGGMGLGRGVFLPDPRLARGGLLMFFTYVFHFLGY